MVPMPSPLQNLDIESALLMYVADELPADARRELEQSLASDAELRRRLEELRAAYAGVHEALTTADAKERLVLPQGTAARRVAQEMRSWHARRLALPRQRAARGGRYPWWTYPLAGAAMITIGLATYWARQSDIVLTGGPPLGMPIDEGPEPEIEVVYTPADAYPAIRRDESDNVLEAADAEFALSESSYDVSGVLYNSVTGATAPN